MALHLANYQKKAADSVRTFWANQGKSSAQRPKTVRGSARSKNMEGFDSLLTDLVAANGPKDAKVIRDGLPPLTLPGYFIPSTKWDMLLLRAPRLVAAIELKSQVDSFGNNFNNRTQEAIGSRRRDGTIVDHK
jgi:hypothetical protein